MRWHKNSGAGLGLEVRDEKDEKKEEEIMGNEGKIKRKKILEVIENTMIEKEKKCSLKGRDNEY
ncbi:hypothetical protein X798_02557 [Onchocerca flexuosa]|uniref:Uncharacterized protein n=1 Tax=Onchocerca flexuosa TaxID=387005 RepID=A0A238BZ51_9BILA|nr:hypothetical protein X798_02557 [Onchocerca flexuosa]